jgi:hypothetical protein
LTIAAVCNWLNNHTPFSYIRPRQASAKIWRRAVLLCLAVSLCSIGIPAGNLNAGTLRMQSYAVSDPQMGGIPAFRVLAPADWKLRGGLTWNVNLANLVTADVAISAPDNSAGFYVHPAPMFISGQIQYQWAQGQSYLGMIVMPMPNDPVAFLQYLVLPQQRPGAGNLRLVKHQDLPDWAAGIAAVNAQPGGMTQGYGTCARFAYTENGAAWEEDFYCVVLVTRSNISPQNAIWLAERNLSVRARKGKLDAMKPLANAFVNSFRVERNWYARFVKIQQQWIAAQQQGIANAGALSRAISQSNDHFDRTMAQSWKARQQAEDRASREFSEYIRGSENYNDPVNGTQVELPGGYEHVWTNPLGEYVMSDDASYNPNMHSNNDWTAIEPVR